MPENLHGATIDRVNKEKCQECCWLESETGEGISRIEGCTVKDTYIETTKYGSRINFEDRCIRYSFSMCSNAGKNGMKHPLTFISRKLSDREKKYSIEERECLTIVWGIQKLNRYLYGWTVVEHSSWRQITVGCSTWKLEWSEMHE